MASRSGAARSLKSLSKTERLEARVTPEMKRKFARAAALEGKTLTEFILDHVDRAAQQALVPDIKANWIPLDIEHIDYQCQ